MTSPYAGLWSLLLILLALLLPDLLSAQSIPSDYGGYRYDSNFTIAGYDVNRTWLLPLVKDELGFSTLVSYTLPTALDPTSIATALLRGDSSVGITRKLLDFLFDSMGTGGSAPALKLMGIPSTISAISKNATSMEAYPDYLFQIVQTGSFDYVTTAGSADTTFTPRHFVKGRDVRPDTSGVSTTVVDRPRYTQRAFRDPVPYPYAVLDTIYGGVARRPGDDAAGVYEGLAEVVPGYADSSRYYYAEVTLSLPQYADIAEDSTTLFIVTLLRRDTLRQTGPGQCRCNLVTPFATLRVRKGNVTQLSENAGDDYVKLGLWFSSIWRIAGGDTVWVSSPFNKGLIQAGTGPGTSPCSIYCDTMIARRKAITDSNDIAWLPAGAKNVSTGDLALGSDMWYRVETSGATTVRLLRGAVNSHLYRALEKGTLDTLFRKDLYPIASNARLNAALRAYGVMDEPHIETLRSFGRSSRKIQEVRSAVLPSDQRQTFAPVYANYDGLRVFSNDFDSTSRKTVQTILEDAYLVWGEPMPVTYANPARMSLQATNLMYRMNMADWRDTIIHRDRLIAGNHASDYAWFTQVTQQRFGTFGDRHSAATAGGSGGPWLANLARAVDVARFKYADRGPASSVLAMITVNGWVDMDAGVYLHAFRQRPPTPEEIRCQVWLSRNCAATGMVFSQMTHVGPAIGPLRIDSAHRWAPHANDYDRLENYKNPSTGWLDTMWVGYDARYNAIKDVSRRIRYIDSVVGWSNLVYAQEQMSVHDLSLSFADIPVVDSLFTERPILDSVPFLSTVPRTIDPRIATYIELTHFLPGGRDTAWIAAGSHYLLVTNRRLYPIDHATYPDSVRVRFDSVAHGADTAVHFSNRGLGNIDVRRPWVKFSTSMGAVAKDVLIQRIDSAGWSATASLRDSVPLEWLRPGEGALYRITPVTSRISMRGTAFNNAVHSENPSTNDSERDRLVVYETDGSVYLQAVDSLGNWSRAMLVSDSFDGVDLDTSVAGWRPKGKNQYPAIAVARDSSTAIVVWQRLDGVSGQFSVEARMLKTLPRALDTGFSSATSIRFTVAGSLPILRDTMPYAPSAVGLLGGFAVAYPSAAMGRGVSLSLIRSRSSGNTIPASDSISVTQIRWTSPGPPSNADTTLFPTLAFASDIAKPDSTWAPKWPDGETPVQGLDAQILHLAYQQGVGGSSAKGQIYYNRIAAIFRLGQRPVLWVSPAEHVSPQSRWCGFRHPSIGVDSLRVGIAFQSDYVSTIILRWRRDKNLPTIARWATPWYEWGSRPTYMFDWPSLTHFPYVDTDQLTYQGGDPSTGPDGTLVWSRDNAAGRTSEQWFYRYGWEAPKRINNGLFPTMTLVAHASAGYFDRTSVLYHGDSTTATSGTRSGGSPATYYPAMLFNGPANLSVDFFTNGASRQMFQRGARVTRFDDPGLCAYTTKAIDWGIPSPVKDSIGGVFSPPIFPGTPPAFFGSGTPPSVDSIETVVQVTRTASFVRGAGPVSVMQRVVRGSEALDWLTSEPYDSVLGEPHDVRVVTELVNDANGAVLWRSDTVSARTMTSDTLERTLSIPSNLADSGTVMYVRMRGMPTYGLSVECTGGFIWTYEDEASSMSRPVAPLGDRGARSAAVRSTIEMTIAPNPAHGHATLFARVPRQGAYRLSVVDERGTERAHFDDVEFRAVAEARFDLDVSVLPTGHYFVRIEALDGSGSGTTPLSVRR